MSDDPPDDIVAELNDLRETVESQQARIDELEADQPDAWQPSRRTVVGGLAGLVGLGAAIPYMSQPAAAQAVGQIGSASERVDVFGATGDFTALEADKVSTTQTWQDVSASRDLNTDETNTTGSDIEIFVTIEADSSGRVSLSGSVGGTVGRVRKDVADNDRVSLSFTVPSGSGYKIDDFSSTSVSVFTWKELRP